MNKRTPRHVGLEGLNQRLEMEKSLHTFCSILLTILSVTVLNVSTGYYELFWIWISNEKYCARLQNTYYLCTRLL